MTKEEAGLAVLGITGASTLWSWGNSSIFTIRNSIKTEQDKENARYGMNLSMGLIILFSLSLYLLYGDHGVYPALFTVLSGLFYYVVYDNELRRT